MYLPSRCPMAIRLLGRWSLELKTSVRLGARYFRSSTTPTVLCQSWYSQYRCCWSRQSCCSGGFGPSSSSEQSRSLQTISAGRRFAVVCGLVQKFMGQASSVSSWRLTTASVRGTQWPIQNISTSYWSMVQPSRRARMCPVANYSVKRTQTRYAGCAAYLGR